MTSNKETYICVWLESAIKKVQIEQALRYVFSHLQIFEKSAECDNYIRASTKEKVVWIMSDAFGESIVARLHDLSQLVYCYIICRDNINDIAWPNQYPKIKGVFKHQDEIFEQLIQDQAIRKNQEDSTLISLMSNDSQSLQSRNASFMWLLLYIEVLFQMHYSEDAKKALVESCMKMYADKPDELINIKQFESEYTSNKAIWWYSLDSCFYRLVNKALGCRDFDMLFILRFFISDVARIIKREHEQFIRTSMTRDRFTVYRGQVVSSDELQLMLDNIGEFISMNSFLSTSRNPKMALSFIRTDTINSNCRRVLFEITIDPRLPTKAFADIKQYSSFPTEDEILIVLGALFRIDKICETPEKNMHTITLSLADDNDYRLKDMFDYMKKRIGNENNLDSLGKILQEMGEYQHALKYYDRMMHETQLALANCHMGMGRALYGNTSYDNALKHYETSLIIRERELGEDHDQVGLSYSRVGVALCRQGEMSKSLINLKKAKEIQERVLPSNSLELAETYNSLGITYFTLNELKLAANYFKKVIAIRNKVLPADHPDIGFAYNNLSCVLENDRQYGLALLYLKKALAISLKILPTNHPDVEKILENICQVTKMQVEQELPLTTNDNSDYTLVASLGMD